MPSFDGVFIMSHAMMPAMHQQAMNGRAAIRNAELNTPDKTYHTVPKTTKLTIPHIDAIIENVIKYFSNFINIAIPYSYNIDIFSPDR